MLLVNETTGIFHLCANPSIQSVVNTSEMSKSYFFDVFLRFCRTGVAKADSHVESPQGYNMKLSVWKIVGKWTWSYVMLLTNIAWEPRILKSLYLQLKKSSYKVRKFENKIVFLDFLPRNGVLERKMAHNVHIVSPDR